VSRARLAALAFVAVLPLAPTAVQAQVEAAPELSGVVLRVGEPLGGVDVVLHRVDAVDAGALDTLPAAADGTFRFSLPTVPDPAGRGELYFASVEHQGVLYFGPPVSTAAELDSLYRIEVYDTLTVPAGGADLPVAVRYMLVEETGQGWSVTDLIELEVTGDRTLVAADSGATWRYLLPAGITDVQVGGGDIAPVSTVFEGEGFTVSMPLTPGSRQMVLRYALPSLDLELPLPGETGELEVLVREPAPAIEVEGLVEVQPVELEPGVSYRRFAAASLVDSAVVLRAGEGAPGAGSDTLPWLMVITALGLTAVGVWAVRRGGPAPAPGSGTARGTGPGPGRVDGTGAAGTAGAMTADERERTLLEIARLDERIEATTQAAEIDRLRAERAALLARLRG
jgi:hypothetical protein